MTNLLVGIDPGTKTGFATWDSDARKLVSIATMTAIDAMDAVAKLHEAGLLKRVMFEDARQRRWFGRTDALVKKYGAAVREGAGAAKKEASMWEAFLKKRGIPYVAVAPQAGATKWSAAYLKRVTGWTERTSEHGRDAACLVIGR